jgi:hypothetical protein
VGAVAVSGGRGRLWRSRWAALGAAVAVTFGGGGMFAVQAASSPASSVVTIDPVRILDTRDPLNVGLAGPFVSALSQKLQVTGPVPTTTGTQTPVPIGATGVLLNVTVVGPTAAGFLSVRPGDATGAPSTSSLNFRAGDIVPNSVQVGLPTAGANAGEIDITYDAYGVAGPTTEVLIDVVGYMVEGAGGTPGPVGPVGPAGPGATQFGMPGPTAINGSNTVGCTIGEVRLSAGSYAQGLPAEGQIIPIVGNFPLFNVIGNTFGGNGSTTFGLPDLRSATPNGLTYRICNFGSVPF